MQTCRIPLVYPYGIWDTFRHFKDFRILKVSRRLTSNFSDNLSLNFVEYGKELKNTCSGLLRINRIARYSQEFSNTLNVTF